MDEVDNKGTVLLDRLLASRVRKARLKLSIVQYGINEEGPFEKETSGIRKRKGKKRDVVDEEAMEKECSNLIRSRKHDRKNEKNVIRDVITVSDNHVLVKNLTKKKRIKKCRSTNNCDKSKRYGEPALSAGVEMSAEFLLKS